jgi:4-hydroxy-tetrahydrodipicolinate synthase
MSADLQGVFAAAVTPLKPDFSLDLDNVPLLLDHLASRGCHGALLMGTTGEGPSFSSHARISLLKSALAVQDQRSDFRLLLATGTPSLDETTELTRSAFNSGADGVVVLPPYFFRKASDDGLFAWFSEVLKRSVPEGGCFLAYHIPAVSGVALSLDLLARLKDAFPGSFKGLKDSSSDPDYGARLGERFGSDLLVLNGNDRLFSQALAHKAAGCITALANLISPNLRLIWDSHQRGIPETEAQNRLNAARDVMDRHSPVPPLIKALLHKRFNLPLWSSCPPLLPAGDEAVNSVIDSLYARS